MINLSCNQNPKPEIIEADVLSNAQFSEQIKPKLIKKITTSLYGFLPLTYERAFKGRQQPVSLKNYHDAFEFLDKDRRTQHSAW